MSHIPRFRPKPWLWALLYALAATGLSVLAANIEDRLWSAEIGVHPFKENISTLVDFSLLNPLVIFFLLRSWRLKSKALAKLRNTPNIPPYHVFGLLVLSLCVGFAAMRFYVDGFLQGTFFDATIIQQDGKAFITMTGWVVFAFTAIFISFVFFMTMVEIFYALVIISLKFNDVKYYPLHIDDCGGLSFLVRPSLNFVYAAIVIALIFVLFILHDRFLNDIPESNRIVLVSIYAPAIIILFGLPILHLRRIMSDCRNTYLIAVGTAVENAINTSNSKGFRDVAQAESYLSLVECVEKYRRLANELPIWPLPTKKFLTPALSAAMSLGPLMYRGVELAMESL